MTAKQIYLRFFGYGEQDRVPCEIPGCPNQVHMGPHHIKYKSRGGKDEIDNLMGLCVLHHDKAHKEELSEGYLRKIHMKFIENFKRWG